MLRLESAAAIPLRPACADGSKAFRPRGRAPRDIRNAALPARNGSARQRARFLPAAQADRSAPDARATAGAARRWGKAHGRRPARSCAGGRPSTYPAKACASVGAYARRLPLRAGDRRLCSARATRRDARGRPVPAAAPPQSRRGRRSARRRTAHARHRAFHAEPGERDSRAARRPDRPNRANSCLSSPCTDRG